MVLQLNIRERHVFEIKCLHCLNEYYDNVLINLNYMSKCFRYKKNSNKKPQTMLGKNNGEKTFLLFVTNYEPHQKKEQKLSKK